MATHRTVRTRLRALVLGLVAAAAPAVAQPVSPIPDTDTGFRVPPETFPIFPWDTMPVSKHFYEEAKAAGFNLAGFVRPDNLDLVRDAGLKAFVSDPGVIKVRGTESMTDDEIAAIVKPWVAKSAGHPATFGYHVIDEPAPALVPHVVRWTSAIQAANPDAIAYVNFFPVSMSAATTRPGAEKVAADYVDYLGRYLSAMKPKAKVFSYDNYPLLDDGALRPHWFPNLELARKASIEHGTPFWVVVLANAHFRYADPSPANFHFEVYTALAHGARGIGMFTFTGRDRGNYRNAAIDLFGHRTATFDHVRDINLQLHRLAPVITKMKSVNVFHTADVPVGGKGLADSKFVKGIRGKGPFCVGEFEDENGKPAVLIVNKDRVHSTTLAVVPKSPAKIHRVSAYTGVTRPWGAEDDWLAPGGGILLRFLD